VMTYLKSHDRRMTVAGVNDNTSIQPGRDKDKDNPTPESSTAQPSKEPGALSGDGDRPTNQAPALPKMHRPPVAQQRLASTSTPTPAQLVREAEQKYLAAIAMLSRDVNRHRSQLDPMLLARFDASLSEIDRTIKETRRVVHENPGDPIALQYLLAAYSKKVEVLRGMTAD
jgi:hypothetical protein